MKAGVVVRETYGRLMRYVSCPPYIYAQTLPSMMGQWSAQIAKHQRQKSFLI